MRGDRRRIFFKDQFSAYLFMYASIYFEYMHMCKQSRSPNPLLGTEMKNNKNIFT